MAEKKAEPKEQKKASYEVVQRFMDADQYVVNGVKNTYEPGADVSHFDADRLKHLEKEGLVKKA